jgi:hypothetical protein
MMALSFYAIAAPDSRKKIFKNEKKILAKLPLEC